MNKDFLVYGSGIAAMMTAQLLSNKNGFNVSLYYEKNKKMISILEESELIFLNVFFPGITEELPKNTLYLLIGGNLHRMPIFIIDDLFYSKIESKLNKSVTILDSYHSLMPDRIQIHAHGKIESDVYEYFAEEYMIYQYSLKLNHESSQECYFISDRISNINFSVIESISSNTLALQFVCKVGEEKTYLNRCLAAFTDIIRPNSVIDSFQEFSLQVSGDYSCQYSKNHYKIGSSLGIIPPSFQAGSLLAILDSMAIACFFYQKLDWNSYLRKRSSFFQLVKKYSLDDIENFYSNNIAHMLKDILRKELIDYTKLYNT